MTNEEIWVRLFLFQNKYFWLCGAQEASLFEKQLAERIRNVVDRETEACAKLVEAEQVFDVDTPGVKEFNEICKRLAHDIRSRKSKS